jgi:hypothetical protein
MSVEPAFVIWAIIMTLLCLRISPVIYVATGMLFLGPLISMRRFPRSMFSAAGELPGPDDLLFALVLLGFIVFGFRFVDELRRMGRIWSKEKPVKPSALQSQTGHSLKEGLLTLTLICGAGFAANLLLIMFPENPESRYLYRLTPAGLRVITFVWLLGLTWVVGHSVFGTIGWLRMNRDEAATYIRNTHARELRPHLGSIERARLKLRQRNE